MRIALLIRINTLNRGCHRCYDDMEDATMSHVQAAISTTPKSLNIFGRPLTIFGVPVDRKTIFSDYKGNYKSRIEKRQRKLIVKTTFIKFFLHHDERIRCLTTGYSPITAVEQLLTGLAFLLFKRAIFVFTDKRILHIPTRFNRSSFSAISQIMYEDCKNIRLKGRTLCVTYNNGKEDQFPYIGRKERRKLKVLLSNHLLKPKAFGQFNKRVHLCPSCTNILNPQNTICPTCKLDFKSAWQARIRSYLIPGGGYFYSHHRLFGALIGAAEIAVLLKLAIDWIAVNQGLAVNLGLTAVLLAGLLGEKLIAAFHAQQLIQNFIPEKKDYALRKL